MPATTSVTSTKTTWSARSVGRCMRSLARRRGRARVAKSAESGLEQLRPLVAVVLNLSGRAAVLRHPVLEVGLLRGQGVEVVLQHFLPVRSQQVIDEQHRGMRMRRLDRQVGLTDVGYDRLQRRPFDRSFQRDALI